MEIREAGRCDGVCMYMNNKGLYCLANVVIVRIKELNWSSWWDRHSGTEGVE